MGFFEDLRHQCFIDCSSTQVILLQHEPISFLFHCCQFLGNTWYVALKHSGDLVMVGCRVNREDLLRRADEVAVGVAHPELSQVPGKVCQWAYNIGSGLLSLTVDGIDALYKEYDLNAAAALPRREKLRAFGCPVGCIIRCQQY